MYQYAILLFFLISVSFIYMIVSKKIVKTLLALITIYIYLIPLLIFLKFDYIALILVLLYIGALAVFFLFVLMTTKIIEKDDSDPFTDELKNYIKTRRVLTPSAEGKVNNNNPRNRYYYFFLLIGIPAILFVVIILSKLSPSPSFEEINLLSSSESALSGPIRELLPHLIEQFEFCLTGSLNNITILANLIFVEFLNELLILTFLLFASAVGAMFFVSV